MCADGEKVEEAAPPGMPVIPGVITPPGKLRFSMRLPGRGDISPRVLWPGGEAEAAAAAPEPHCK
jgi:hypothetical protein